MNVCTCGEAKEQGHVSSSMALYVTFRAGPGACSPVSFMASPPSYGSTRVSNTPSFLFGWWDPTQVLMTVHRTL